MARFNTEAQNTDLCNSYWKEEDSAKSLREFLPNWVNSYRLAWIHFHIDKEARIEHFIK